MNITAHGDHAEPDRDAARHPPARRCTRRHQTGGESVAFSIPAGLSVWRVLVASYPWSAALYQGPCPPAAGTALLVTRRPSFLASGGEERLDRPNPGHPVPGRRHHHAYLRTVSRAAWGRAVRGHPGGSVRCGPSVLLPAQDPPGGHSRGESGPGAGNARGEGHGQGRGDPAHCGQRGEDTAMSSS